MLAAASLDRLDWDRLDRLRSVFLSRAGGAPYWTGPEDLAQYDATFGERIGWKWDAVLAELAERGWQPPEGAVLDWGCGSGVAGRRLVDAFGTEWFRRLLVHDRSAEAMGYARRKAATRFPGLEAADDNGRDSIGTLVVSHVVSELDSNGTAALHEAIARSHAVLWVEPGTPDDSRALIAARERLIGDFTPVAPCTHRKGCGMLEAGQERHWCHHFADPPRGVLGDPGWTRFAERAGIDLRSTPYSFLVLDRRGAPSQAPGLRRVIGRARSYKGYLKVLSCEEAGIREVGLQRRDQPGVVRAFEKGPAPRVLSGVVGPKGWLVVDR